MTAVQSEPPRQAGEVRPGGFFGWNPGQRMRLAMKAGAFSAAGFAGVQGLRILQQLFIANLIGSADYGRAGLIATVIAGLGLLSEIGITQNIVQSRRGDDPELLNTAYSVNAARGVILWLIGALLAYPTALFYNDMSLMPMLAVAASSLAIRGFMSSAVWTLTRHVQVHKLTVLNLVSEVVGFGVGLAWVYRDPSAWALIAGSVGASVVYTAGSLLLGRRPTFGWSRTALHELVTFGVWLFVSTATYFAASQAERLALGKFVSKEELGCFTMAVTMASAPTRAIQQLVEQVFFPMISRLCRDDPARSHLQYRRVKWITLGIAVAAAGVCILGGPLAVRLLLYKQPSFAATGWMLQLLGFRAAWEILTGPTVSMLFANGQSKFAGVGNVARLLVMVPGLWIALSGYGLYEAVWVLTLAPLAAYAVTLNAVRVHLRPSLAVEALTAAILLGCSCVFGLVYRLLS